MLALPRICHKGCKGGDVLAYKKGIGHWEAHTNHAAILNRPYSPLYRARMVRAVEQFQTKNGLKVDGVIGQSTYLHLYPWVVKGGGIYFLQTYAKRHRQTKGDNVLAELRWAVHNSGGIHYQYGARPVPYGRFANHWTPIYADCSSFTDGIFFAAGAAPPSGNYDGQVFTGSYIEYLRHISRDALTPCDLVIFGAYPGLHVVTMIGGGDCVSHGHEGSPDDPRAMPLADMEGYFRGIGVNTVYYLSTGLTVSSNPFATAPRALAPEGEEIP